MNKEKDDYLKIDKFVSLLNEDYDLEKQDSYTINITRFKIKLESLLRNLGILESGKPLVKSARSLSVIIANTDKVFYNYFLDSISNPITVDSQKVLIDKYNITINRLKDAQVELLNKLKNINYREKTFKELVTKKLIERGILIAGQTNSKDKVFSYLKQYSHSKYSDLILDLLGLIDGKVSLDIELSKKYGFGLDEIKSVKSEYLKNLNNDFVVMNNSFISTIVEEKKVPEIVKQIKTVVENNDELDIEEVEIKNRDDQVRGIKRRSINKSTNEKMEFYKKMLRDKLISSGLIDESEEMIGNEKVLKHLLLMPCEKIMGLLIEYFGLENGIELSRDEIMNKYSYSLGYSYSCISKIYEFIENYDNNLEKIDKKKVFLENFKNKLVEHGIIEESEDIKSNEKVLNHLVCFPHSVITYYLIDYYGLENGIELSRAELVEKYKFSERYSFVCVERIYEFIEKYDDNLEKINDNKTENSENYTAYLNKGKNKLRSKNEYLEIFKSKLVERRVIDEKEELIGNEKVIEHLLSLPYKKITTQLIDYFGLENGIQLSRDELRDKYNISLGNSYFSIRRINDFIEDYDNIEKNDKKRMYLEILKSKLVEYGVIGEAEDIKCNEKVLNHLNLFPCTMLISYMIDYFGLKSGVGILRGELIRKYNLSERYGFVCIDRMYDFIEKYDENLTKLENKYQRTVVECNVEEEISIITEDLKSDKYTNEDFVNAIIKVLHNYKNKNISDKDIEIFLSKISNLLSNDVLSVDYGLSLIEINDIIFRVTVNLKKYISYEVMNYVSSNINCVVELFKSQRILKSFVINSVGVMGSIATMRLNSNFEKRFSDVEIIEMVECSEEEIEYLINMFIEFAVRTLNDEIDMLSSGNILEKKSTLLEKNIK